MFTMALAGRAVTAWAGDPGALVEYQVRFGRPVVVPDDDEGAEVTVRGVVGALLTTAALAGRPTVTSGGEKVLSLARAIVRLGLSRCSAAGSGDVGSAGAPSRTLADLGQLTPPPACPGSFRSWALPW